MAGLLYEISIVITFYVYVWLPLLNNVKIRLCLFKLRVVAHVRIAEASLPQLYSVFSTLQGGIRL
jgi:hypothetical protein